MGWGPAHGTEAPPPAALCRHAGARVSDLERAILEEANLARTRPDLYAAHVERRFAGLDGTKRYRSGGVLYQMQEGRQAVAEAVSFLKYAKPVPPLDPSPCLALAARDLVRDQGATGATGHAGADGSSPMDRASRYVEGTAYAGENVSYGEDTAREVVVAMIVDDGVPGRGHRRNLFDPRYRMLGVAFGPHPGFRTVAVLVFSTNEIREAAAR